MSLSVKILEDDREIQKRIHQAIADSVNKTVTKNSKRAERLLHRLIPTWIRSQPEIISLLSEQDPTSLNAQFGLTPGQGVTVLDEIVEAVIQATSFKLERVNKNLNSEIKIEIQPKDFNNVKKSF